MDTVIKVDNLSKSYLIGHQKQERYVTLRDVLAHQFRSIGNRLRHPLSPNKEVIQQEDFWALKNIDMEIKQGEVVGIIGRNGAGKSTLLKILSRITAPTKGSFILKGRVVSLLEVGTGFHPELSGRENIFLNGAILGMKKKEIKRKFDEIVAFAEVEKFLDTPVKRYSTGMYVRLAFAVAAHLEPEILLVDEVLAVGDAGFQKKCLGKMGNVAKKGRTILFVSHNMAAVENLCQKTIFLSQGQIHSSGNTNKVIDNYLRLNSQSKALTTNLLLHPNRRPGSEPVLRRARIFVNEKESTTIQMGERLRIETSFTRENEITNMRFGIAIENTIGQRIISFSPSHQAPQLINNPVRNGTIICDIPCIRLLPGLYYITLIIGSGSADLDRIDQAFQLIVESADVYKTGYAPDASHGVFFQETSWKMQPS